MNIKPLLFVPGLLALSISCFSIPPVAAQTESSPTPVQMQRGMNKLNLTDAQKAQMKQLRQETQAEIEQILTTEQRAKMQSLKQSGGKMRGAMKELNLSAEQKQQIRQIREKSQQKLQAILTDEQRALMQQKRQNWQERRSQRHSPSTPAQSQ